MLTVAPVASLRARVSPAGTVNELMLTVVHLTASSTSSKDEIVPVHGVEAAYVNLGAEPMARARKIAVSRLNIACPGFVSRTARVGVRSSKLEVCVVYIPPSQR